MSHPIYAVFGVAYFRRSGMVCATTRTDGSIGLPGGKIDPGEDAFTALRREAFEEGWKLTVSRIILRDAMVDGHRVLWIKCATRTNPLSTDWKEKHRGIYPIAVLPEMLTPGLGNEFLSEK
jgi:8-oxo-dGTP pyrophosphatase MutT (NUDIX family)